MAVFLFVLDATPASHLLCSVVHQDSLGLGAGFQLTVMPSMVDTNLSSQDAD